MAERVAAYPRPPALVPCEQHVRVEALGRVLCDTRRSLRVSKPSTRLSSTSARRMGTWARWSPSPGGDGSERRLHRALWSYPSPTPAFAPLPGWLACCPALMDGCSVDGERVIPQPGSFYGGWITTAVAGPFKGDPLHPELR